MFVEKELNNDIWESDFQPILQKIKLEKFAITLTRMCQLYLGLKTKNITWCTSVNPSLCDELLKYFIEKGNFGRKAEKKEQVIFVLSNNKNIFQFSRNLQSNGKLNWKLSQKYHILKPLAWSYQICRYIHAGFHRKHPIHSLIKDWKKVGQEFNYSMN